MESNESGVVEEQQQESRIFRENQIEKGPDQRQRKAKAKAEMRYLGKVSVLPVCPYVSGEGEAIVTEPLTFHR